MRIREIGLANFMSHAASRIELPDTGVVVVTGPNGAGKSSIVEAVAVAGWGKTLRGSQAWSGDNCAAHLVAHGLDISRVRKKFKTTLAWRVVEDGTESGRVFDALARLGGLPEAEDKWESTTHAQDALERCIGGFDVWRRAHAFSSSDAAHFSLATDSERKRLLESILGLDKFDVALERCRLDLRNAGATLYDAQRKVDLQRESVGGEERRLGDAEGALQRATADLPELLQAPSAADRKRLEDAIGRSNADEERLVGLLRVVDRTVARAEADAATAERALARLAVDKCPTCTQSIGHALKKQAEVEAHAAHDCVESAKADRTKRHAAIQGELEELRHEVAVLAVKYSDMKVAVRASEERALARARAEATRKTASDIVEQAQARLASHRAALVAAEQAKVVAGKRVAVLSAVELVLGLRGVRAHVLSKSLRGLTVVSNAWLPKLGLPGLTVDLKPYSEKKTGGVTDAISIEIGGAGGGHGYKGASAGERRRIDLALLLGIAEVASASAGRSGSTLFFDELFDALDRDGVHAVSNALGELAQDRTVVVITHNEELAARLPAVKRLRIQEGTVS